MDVSVACISDFICPWCYLGKVRLVRIKEALSQEGIHLRIHLKPFLLYPHIPLGGLDKRLFKKAKPGFGPALKAAAEAEKIEINYKRIQKIPNSMMAHCFTWSIEDPALQFSVSTQIFKDYFQKGQDIEDPSYFEKIGSIFNIPDLASKIIKDNTTVREAVQESIQQTHEAGIAIVPTLQFGPGIHLPGLQSYDVWVNYIRRAMKIQNPI